MVSQFSTIQREALEQLLQNYQSWTESLTTPPVVEQHLDDGLSNSAVLLKSADKRWVARLSRQPAPLGTNFAREVMIHSAAARAKAAPQIAHSDQESGLLVTEFIDRADTQPPDICALAGLLQRVHGIEIRTAILDVPTRIGEFLQLLPPQHWLRRLVDTHFKSLEALFEAASCDGQTLCHNDLLLANRRRGSRLIAIDWEYACKGDPLFDIAVCMSELTSDHRISLLRNYFEREPSSLEKEKVTIYQQLYQVLAALWCAVYAPHSLTDAPTEPLLDALQCGEQYR